MAVISRSTCVRLILDLYQINLSLELVSDVNVVIFSLCEIMNVIPPNSCTDIALKVSFQTAYALMGKTLCLS